MTAQNDAVEQLRASVVRLQDELDGLLRMAAFQRKAMENEMMDGLGYKQMATSAGVLEKFKSLSMTTEKLVDVKIRLDKSLKLMADKMTPEEEKSAVMAYLKTLSVGDRAEFLNDINYWHLKFGGGRRAERTDVPRATHCQVPSHEASAGGVNVPNPFPDAR